MNEPHVAAPQGAGPRYSPDGRWQWDGQRWTPVADAGQAAIIQPPRDFAQAPPEPARAAGNGLTGLALALGIGAIVAGAAVWTFSYFFGPNRVDNIVLAVVLALGFVAGVAALVLALAPSRRPRGPGHVAAFTCGLIGLGVLVLFASFALANYP